MTTIYFTRSNSICVSTLKSARCFAGPFFPRWARLETPAQSTRLACRSGAGAGGRACLGSRGLVGAREGT